jgi:hypothetical protein
VLVPWHLSGVLSAVSGVPVVAMPVFVGLVPPVPAKRAESQLMPGRTCLVCLFLHSFVSFKIGETGETMRQSPDLQALSGASLVAPGWDSVGHANDAGLVCSYFIPSRLSTFTCHLLPLGTS